MSSPVKRCRPVPAPEELPPADISQVGVRRRVVEPAVVRAPCHRCRRRATGAVEDLVAPRRRVPDDSALVAAMVVYLSAVTLAEPVNAARGRVG